MDSTNIQYADAQNWQDIMKNKSRVKMYELIQRLGLRANWSSNKRGKTNFYSIMVRGFVSDMTNVAHTLPKDADELIAYLAAPGSLNEEIEALLQKHGLAIWGRMSSRDHLVSVGEPGVEPFYYPKELYYEDEEDRELIRILLHWWIGLKACNILLSRERMDRERRKKDDRLRHRNVNEPSHRDPIPTVPIAPAFRSESFPYRQPEPPRHALRLDTSYSNPASPVSGTPLNSNDSPVVPVYGFGNESSNAFPAKDMNSTRHASILSWPRVTQSSPDFAAQGHTSLQPLPTLHQLSSELGALVSNFLEDSNAVYARQPPSPPIDDGHDGAAPTPPSQQALDGEALLAFRRYIYPEESGPKWDEVILLRRLETAWRDKVRTDQRALGNTALFAAMDRAFLTWIELRRHLADLARAEERWSQEADPEEKEARAVEYKTLKRTSRDLLRIWEGIGQDPVIDWAPEGWTGDDILVQAFILLAGESGANMNWGPMLVKASMQWLCRSLEQCAAEETDVQEGLLYVRA